MMIFDITRKGFRVLIVVTIPNVIPSPPDLPPPPNGDSHHILNDTNARMSNNIENSNSLILFYIANFVAGISSLIVVSREPIFYFVPRENNILDGDLRKGKDCSFFRQFCCENCSLFHSRTLVNWFSKNKKGRVDDSVLVSKKRRKKGRDKSVFFSKDKS